MVTRRRGSSKYGLNGPSVLKISNGASTNVRVPAKDTVSQHYEPPRALQDADEDIFGPPLSDDEDEETICKPIDSSDEDEQVSADIKPTIWKSKDGSARSTREKHVSESSNKTQPEQSPSNRTRRRTIDAAASIAKKAKLEDRGLPDQDKGSSHDMFAPSQTRKKGTMTTYGSQPRKRTFGSSQSNSGSSPMATFKHPLKFELESPNSPEKRFCHTGVDPELLQEYQSNDTKKFKRYQMNLSPDSSPRTVPQFKTSTFEDGLMNIEEDAPIFKLPSAMEYLGEDAREREDLSSHIPALLSGEDGQSQIPTFRIPSNFDDDDAIIRRARSLVDGHSKILSDPEASDVEEEPVETALLSPNVLKQSTCPMCGEAIDAGFLETYNGGKRMNVRIQAKFCRAHKKNTAQAEWTSRGYPTIDWSALDARIANHHAYIKSLLDGASSHSRDLLNKNVRSGKDRTLVQAVIKSGGSLAPGYYGSRGLRAMSENIMFKFSPQLRKIAVKDRLVSARGVTGYVQTVLVPELATRLIGEDMGVSIEEARQVMKDSIGLGDLVNEDLEDVVILQEGDS